MSVLNITLRNNLSEDETLWRANTWTKEVLHIATSDRAELTAEGYRIFCVLHLFSSFICKLSVCVGWGEQS